MTYVEYQLAVKLLKEANSFPVLLTATMRAASIDDQVKLQKAFPEHFAEMVARTNSQDGKLPSDQ